MIVRIIRGVYGYRDPEGVLVAKDRHSEPFALDADKAERLIRLKVAEAVEEESTGETAEAEPEDDLSGMTIAQLRAKAKESGLSAKGTKQDLIDRIKAGE